MNRSIIGASAGTILALTWIVLGFWAFVLVAVAMFIGAMAGRAMDGRFDPRAFADAFRGRRSSS